MLRWVSMALVLASSLFTRSTLGELVVITEYASACSAIYTSGSQTTTVVQSTIVVQPEPWTDSQPNTGTPFVLEVMESTSQYNAKRNAPSWLTMNGNTTTDGMQATQYTIGNGMLTTISGETLSAADGDEYAIFAASTDIGMITTTFAINSSVLTWVNAAFDTGAAEFFVDPAWQADSAMVLARFAGPNDAAWEAVMLYAKPGQSSTTINRPIRAEY